jgi:hypothetical protein
VAVDPDAPYPPPAPTAIIEQTDAYPADGADDGIRLALDKPILPGATEVTGVGPPGLVVYLMNITFMGESVGTGSIGADGTFRIPIMSLEEGNRVGLNADVTTIGLTNDDIQLGEGALSVPQVGFFFDSVVVRQ